VVVTFASVQIFIISFPAYPFVDTPTEYGLCASLYPYILPYDYLSRTNFHVLMLITDIACSLIFSVDVI
jgi:hypothetical protein